MLFIPSSSLEEGINCIKLTFSQSFLTPNTQIKGCHGGFLTQRPKGQGTHGRVHAIDDLQRIYSLITSLTTITSITMKEDFLTYKIIGCIYKVFKNLGPGLLEVVYKEALVYELTKSNLQVDTEVKVPIIYDNVRLDHDLRLDILVERQVIIELKTVKELQTIHYQQLLSYLRIADLHIGLLVNFNTTNIKNDIHRIVNGYTQRLLQSTSR